MKTSDVLLSVRARLNRAAMLQALAWSLAIGGGVLLVSGLACVLQGYPLLGWCWAATAIATGLTFTTLYLRRRATEDDAARFADQYFNLKDTLTSDLHFQREGRSGEFFDLINQQAVATAARVKPEGIALPAPKRMLALGTLLVLAGFSLSFRSPSPEVVARWKQEAETHQLTAELNEEVKKQIEELKKALGDDNDLISKEDLKKWEQELRQTKDMKEAMRQYAMLERRIAEAEQKMNRRDQEELARQAGEALQQDPANRQLGQQLSNKQFAEAAKQLSSMQPQGEGASPEQQRQQMEKLRSAAQRMGQVAKEAMQRKQQSKSGASGESSDSSLAQNMASLEDAVRKMDDALKQAQQQQKQNASQQQQQQSQSQCKNASSQCQSQLNKLCNNLNKLSQCRSASQSLSKLSQCLSQCQGCLNGQCNKPGSKPGGKKAGNGTVESRRNESDPLPFTTETMQIQGQKGQGPSDKTSEAADSGDRTGSRRAGARERTYQKQAESFVRREDVPAEVKEGVKNYFKTIQDKPEDKPAPLPVPAKPEAPKDEKPLSTKKAVS